mmetsp:Transcript_99534/g.319442  ORF Transcript_99534/g.319442 Transcript_99534/m.319442 type:complete len:270 (+) Transcript_99534:1122-1931(+)
MMSKNSSKSMLPDWSASVRRQAFLNSTPGFRSWRSSNRWANSTLFKRPSLDWSTDWKRSRNARTSTFAPWLCFKRLARNLSCTRMSLCSARFRGSTNWATNGFPMAATSLISPRWHSTLHSTRRTRLLIAPKCCKAILKRKPVLSLRYRNMFVKNSSRLIAVCLGSLKLKKSKISSSSSKLPISLKHVLAFLWECFSEFHKFRKSCLEMSPSPSVSATSKICSNSAFTVAKWASRCACCFATSSSAHSTLCCVRMAVTSGKTVNGTVKK